ncbi:putative acyl carrier protein [Candidozyma auris]
MFRAAVARSLRPANVPMSMSRVVVLPRLAVPSFAQISRSYAGFPALTRDVARERIIELLEGYDKVSNKDITESSNFVTDLGLDSLDVVEVVMEVEHEFNIQIPDHEADSLKTYIRGPVYRVSKIPFNFTAAKSYGKDLIFWGGAAGAAVATFTDNWPLFQQTFYSKIPYFGEHWIHNPDPEDVPV